MSDDIQTAPEDQDTPQEKLLAGKFKTPEELEQAYQESVRGYSQLSEDYDRAQRYISMMDQPAPQAQQDYIPVEGGEEEVPDAYKSFVRKELDARERRIRESANYEREFFTRHKDLVGHEKLAIFHATQLRAERGGRPLDNLTAMDEVAKRCRAHIEEIRNNGKTPPHVEGGSRGERPGQPKSPKFLSEEDRLGDFMEESRKKRQQQLMKG